MSHPIAPPAVGSPSARPADETFGGVDHVEVLVEDLFVEEYDKPHPLVQAREGKLARVARPLRRKAPTLLGGLLALGGLVLAVLFVRRGAFARLGFSR
jgi:hypothetical protein